MNCSRSASASSKEYEHDNDNKLVNDAKTRKRLSVHHANILSTAEAMYYDRGHRDNCWAKYERLTEHLSAADSERLELLEALKAMVSRFEEKAGEKPHGNCGCSYCIARAVIAKAKL